ncbi:DNA-binding MarR family transcriptional regulator [Kribbella kalugense]|uniref:DNA-binding MarR family transcriptional regulator n=2 Tax=Kribbella kalugense TaxID=2512221 RepID=A0A4R7ZU70_9ACTN|nr:DNA-binding MarR family transcriptional regulator [Kribbella kalugense]
MEPDYTGFMPQHGRTLPTVDLSMLLNQASYAVSMRLGAALAAIDISVKTYCVLAKGVEGDFTQAQLAERAWMDKTTMVNVLDDMERSGLASRTMSPTDRRVRIVAITAKGRSLLNKADAIVQTTYDEVLESMTGARRTEFLNELTALVEGPLAAPFHMEEQLRTRRSKS